MKTNTKRTAKRTTKPSRRLTLKDRLSRLTLAKAEQLLGDEGPRLIRQGSKFDNIDVDRDVYLRGDLFRLTLHEPRQGKVRVSITLQAARNNRLHWNCDRCERACEHVGAAFALILDDKYVLGLSDIPHPDKPAELLNERQLLQRALAERAQRASQDKFTLRSGNPETPWTDYVITSGRSGKSYRLAVRGMERGMSFCACPDFRTNTLGTCKHLIYALDRIQAKFSAHVRNQPLQNTTYAVHLLYGDEITLWLQVPDKQSKWQRQIVGQLAAAPIEDLHALFDAIQKLESRAQSVLIYPDAEQWIQERLHQENIGGMVDEIRRDPENHPLRSELLRTELLPYQLDGIAFAVGVGRAILADDMGLGKTIQGIGVAELLSRVSDLRRVLVVCPASLKSQWRNEIQRFSNRDVQLIIGTAKERREQYDNDCFFTICNYEQVVRDITAVESANWDLIILDEGQRIKNWETKTSNIIKGLRSRFALVLTGTPLENRLDELYSVVQFIDDRRLGPGFRFFHRHRVVDAKGKVIGYKNLDLLRRTLRPIMLRRTRHAVLKQLPERNTQIVRIPATAEQSNMSLAYMAKAARIAAKKFLTEMDFLQIQKALLAARMAADSTFLVDKQEPAYSTKLEHLSDFLPAILQEPDRKVVLFSEWTTMLNLIEPLLKKNNLDFVRLDGSVPQKKRQHLVNRFTTVPECRLFLCTNAGSTGLNLQAANTVINVDLPWNPAVLEQRIGRAHRMGQQRQVDVFVLVTESTLEERLLETLANKQELALAVLDPDSEVCEVDFQSAIEDMKRRLECLLGSQPHAPVDQSSQRQAEQQLAQYAIDRQRVAAAGGQLLTAAFGLLDQLLPAPVAPPQPELVAQLEQNLQNCLETGADGRPRISFTLPDGNAVNQLATVLARLLHSSAPPC